MHGGERQFGAVWSPWAHGPPGGGVGRVRGFLSVPPGNLGGNGIVRVHTVGGVLALSLMLSHRRKAVSLPLRVPVQVHVTYCDAAGNEHLQVLVADLPITESFEAVCRPVFHDCSLS